MVVPFQQVVGEIPVFQFEARSAGGEVPVVFGVIVQACVIVEVVGVFAFEEIEVTVVVDHQVGEVVVFPGGSDVELQVADVELEEFQRDGMAVVGHVVALVTFLVHIDVVVLEFVGQRHTLELPGLHIGFQFHFRAESQAECQVDAWVELHSRLIVGIGLQGSLFFEVETCCESHVDGWFGFCPFQSFLLFFL